jgi:hypothetical protein
VPSRTPQPDDDDLEPIDDEDLPEIPPALRVPDDLGSDDLDDLCQDGLEEFEQNARIGASADDLDGDLCSFEEEDSLDVLAPMLVLPWSTEAELPDLGVTVPARLDPSVERTEWYTPSSSESAVRLRVRIGSLQVHAEALVRYAEAPRLVLGRDVLAGRILVRSTR